MHNRNRPQAIIRMESPNAAVIAVLTAPRAVLSLETDCVSFRVEVRDEITCDKRRLTA